MIIDAHQHFWKLGQFNTGWLDVPQHASIRRDFVPADLQVLINAAGVDHTIFVQTQHTTAENRWVLELAEQYPFIAGVVGWVDLASPECEQQILEFKQYPKFVGVRHVVQDEPDDNFIIRPDVLKGLGLLQAHQVPYDLLFYVKHLRHAKALAEQFPGLKMVIDHLSKPRIKEQVFDDWEANFRAAARFPNMYCKLSGMVTEADWRNWQPHDLKPYIDIALEAFGPQRLMFGSDWPVSVLAATYAEVLDALRDSLSHLTGAEQSRIFSGTAIEFYGLSIP